MKDSSLVLSGAPTSLHFLLINQLAPEKPVFLFLLETTKCNQNYCSDSLWLQVYSGLLGWSLRILAISCTYDQNAANPLLEVIGTGEW